MLGVRLQSTCDLLKMFGTHLNRILGIAGMRSARSWIKGLPCGHGLQKTSVYRTQSMYTSFEAMKTEVNKFDPNVPVESAITPPASWYTMPEFHNVDNAGIFHNTWVAIARAEQVAKPGQYITGFLAGEPYIITRNKFGDLKAFYNVCRHHATPVMDESEGMTDSFQCPYHGWTYDLDGRLIKATRLKGIKDFHARDFCLKPIQVQTWGPILFISLAEEESDLHQWLKPLYDLLEGSQFSKGVKFIEKREYQLKCNWKIFIDNYLDGGYHVDYAHKDLSALLESNSYKTQTFDGFSVQSSAAMNKNEDLTDNKHQPQRVTDQALYSHIFPNLMLNSYGPWLDLNYCFPLDHENCVVIFEWFLEQSFLEKFSDDELGAYVEESIKASDKVQQEDVWLCERVQRGIQSKSYEYGRYAPRLEHADHEFHIKLADHYTKWLGKKRQD